MKTELKETNKLIAERQAPGDRWVLVGIHDATIYESLTDALNAYFMAVDVKPKAYRLEPQNSRLFAVIEEQVEIKNEIKYYNIYGDPVT